MATLPVNRSTLKFDILQESHLGNGILTGPVKDRLKGEFTQASRIEYRYASFNDRDTF
jgi:hypothetical protein